MWTLHRERIGGQPTQLVELAVPVEERAALEQLRENPVPFEALIIATVRIDGDSMHVEVVLIPAAYDVEPRAPVGHMIDGRDRFGYESRCDQWHVDGGEEADLLCY